MLITKSADVADFCAVAAKSDFVTVDTEFVREKTYWPILCLIQVATRDEAVAIDPLANGIDLEPLYDLMKNTKVLKVFHSASQDMQIMFNASGGMVEPVFDTQIAAMVCGFGDSVGYEKLVDKLLRKKIDKSSRFSNWAKRPLTNKQLNYAIGDVTHLFEIYPILNDALKEKKRTRWLDEELKILTSENTYNTDPELAYKRLKIRGYDLKTRGVTFQLAKLS